MQYRMFSSESVTTNYYLGIWEWGGSEFSRIEAILDEPNWDVVSGTWDSLLMQVERVDISMEFISGSETIYFACLSGLSQMAKG